ncbi:MAG: hypothetical protein WBW38_03565, partial [Candidatus Sulfotelmatobacter sp.]
MMKVGQRVFVCLVAVAMSGAGFGQAPAATDPSAPNPSAPGTSADEGLVIEPTELPATYPQGQYQVNFHGRGNFVPVLHWRVQSGALPPGIRLEDNGVLHGEAERAGEFQFVVSVKDGGQPQQAVQRGFVIKVV